MAAFSGFMGAKSYVEGFSFSPADSDLFAKCGSCPDATKYPHAYRWYIHIAALSGGAVPPPPAPKAAAAPAPAKAAKADDDDDFDVFGDDDDEEEATGEKVESRAEMLARLKK